MGPESGGKFIQDHRWSLDVSTLYAALTDGTITSYDPKSSVSACLKSTQLLSIGFPKPTKIAVVGQYFLASTLNASRQRELRISLSDPLGASLHVVTLETASKPFTLRIGIDRSLVFMASRGEATVRWIEVDDARNFGQKAFPVPPRTTFGSAALLPPLGLDVIRAEINRLYVLTADTNEIVPISIHVPQR